MSWQEKMHPLVSKMEILLAERLQSENLRYRTQEPVWISSADFYFETKTRPLLVFVDGPPHLDMAQAKKDDVFRSAMRQSGYRVLELPYKNPSDVMVESMVGQIRAELAKLGMY